jgi:hypothetical protein
MIFYLKSVNLEVDLIRDRKVHQNQDQERVVEVILVNVIGTHRD